MEREQISALQWLKAAQEIRVTQGLQRNLQPVPPGSINLASNDYLGLARRQEISAGAASAAAAYGGGSSASRLVVGTTELHLEFEREFAEFLGYPSALVFSSGYLANIGAITALVGPGDLIVSDGGSHASLIDGCRLSGATIVVVERGQTQDIARILKQRKENRALVVSDSVYSIDGVVAPVQQLYDAARAGGAVLLLDEAHAMGVRGAGGKGVASELGLSGALDLVTTAVLSKSLAAQGGVVLGSVEVRDHLINRARTFIFDTALNPAALGAAQAALRMLKQQPELVTRLRVVASKIAAGLDVNLPDAAVISVVIGDPARALAIANRVRERGVVVGCFRPPSVPAGTSRLRLTATADLSDEQIETAVAIIKEEIARG